MTDNLFWYTNPQPGDWPEDFEHENGCYMCNCHNCGCIFAGYKRRRECKECYNDRHAMLAQELGDEELLPEGFNDLIDEQGRVRYEAKCDRCERWFDWEEEWGFEPPFKLCGGSQWCVP